MQAARDHLAREVELHAAAAQVRTIAADVGGGVEVPRQLVETPRRERAEAVAGRDIVPAGSVAANSL